MVFNRAISLAILLAITASASFAGEEQSRSIKESTKREIFIKEVVARPQKFEWEGHAVKLGECWLERNVPSGKLPFICFRLEIDQSFTEELAIQKNKNRSIEFREEGRVGKTLVIASTVIYPIRNYLSRLRKGTGEIVHFIELPIPLPKRVAIRLCTHNHETDTVEPTNVVLRFEDLR